MKKENNMVKPFLKWAGGKSQLLKEIEKYYPFDNKITKYAEPFVGGGAVLFDILSKYNLSEVYISDINAELINAYAVVRDNINELISLLSKYQNEYLSLEIEKRKVYYIQKRDRFNELKLRSNENKNIEKATLMIFLNKTCFNGLFRVNKKGFFNVPMGAYKNPLICDEINLRAVSEKLKNVKIVCGDYKKSASFIDEHTFVYFDPPYRPITETASFTAYTENLFNDEKQIELSKFVECINKIGAKVVVSNSDPKNSNTDDNFFDIIYARYKIKRVEATRMINCNSEARGKIKELLISNFKEDSNMIKNGKGGGNTKTGLIFEGKTDLETFLSKQSGYKIENKTENVIFQGKQCTIKVKNVYFNNSKVAELYKKQSFYNSLLKKLDIVWEDHISKKLLPDDSIFVIIKNTVYIIECKHQQVAGSVDEKLQTCDFKKKEYKKLLAKANLDVEYIYLLNDWFKDPRYKDVLDYIHSVNCDYYFEYIPLYKLGLPMPKDI